MPPKSDPITDQLIDIASGGEVNLSDRRMRLRHPYTAMVAMVIISPNGERGQPLILRAKDLSTTGICVISRNMIYTGTEGAMQMLRSDGRIAMLGVRVKHCRYVGNMEHQTGLAFAPVPLGITAADFLDKRGRPILLSCHSREPGSSGEPAKPA